MSCNCLLNHTDWGKTISATLRIWIVWHKPVIHTEIKEVLQQIRVEEKISPASIWEAVSFKTVTLNRLSSGVPDRCQILGTAGSNPWPSDCRWASALYQTKSGLAGRCFLLYFLWYCNLCWSGIKENCPGAYYRSSFHLRSLKWSKGKTPWVPWSEVL